MTDPKDIKAGDWVHVRVHVRKVDVDGFWSVGDRAYFGLDEIVHVEPRPIAVGDIVGFKNCAPGWVVMAVDGDSVWLKLKSGPDGARCSALLAEVVRA